MRTKVLSEQEIKEIIKRLGKEFTNRFKDEKVPPIFIAVLKGALPFFIDLVREIECPVMLDFVQLSSYAGSESTGVISLKKDITMDIRNRKVVVVEDIVDTGFTLDYLTKYLKEHYQPKEVITCTLLDKPSRRKVNFQCDYVGKEIGNYFIVGYGLDYDEYYRNDKEIFVPDLEEIKKIDSLREVK